MPYALRYPFEEAYTPEDNYCAWIPDAPFDIMKDSSWGKHEHEFIPVDYVPKKEQQKE